jgi:hypothetical protein
MSTVIITAPSNATDPKRLALEVADVFRQYGPAYRAGHVLSRQQRRAMHAIEACRTAALGGHIEECDRCSHRRPVYNSCRNRHCPKCQALAKAQWLAQRQAELLPVGYFHTVFTLPHELNRLLAANQAVLYALLFRTAAAALQEFAADPQYGLGGQLGFTAVLHTWDQKLLYHVHLHCVIAGGALAFDGSRWIAAQRNYLFPVQVLSQVFRDKYLAGVRQARASGQLCFPEELTPLENAAALAELLGQLASKEWVLYTQPPWAGPEKALDYLSRYTHRVAISNHRLRQLQDDRVTFDYRDRRDGDRLKQLTLPATEFVRRFLLHVVPEGFCRIRHYGFLGNRHKEERLARCRELLGAAAQALPEWPRDSCALLLQLTGIDVTRCPHCRAGRMVVVERLPGPEESAVPGAGGRSSDSS